MNRFYKSRIRIVAVFLIPFALLTGCTSTIPLRSKHADAAAQPAAIYPLRVAVFPWIDKRPIEVQAAPKRISWPGSKGRIDYFGKEIESGYAAFVADYTKRIKLFQHAEAVPFIVNEDRLEEQGFNAALTGDLVQFEAGFAVPKWTLIVALLPLPATSLVAILWPKEMAFKMELQNVKLRDLKSSKILWQGEFAVEESQKKMSPHFLGKWYLGEAAERLTKKLVQELIEAQLSV